MPNRGFTLIELLIVLAIIFILMSIVGPLVWDWLKVLFIGLR